MKVLVGIDPGVATGFAVTIDGSLHTVTTLTILTAMAQIFDSIGRRENVHVYWEDARLRTWFGSKGREALMGAGSIKRDCSIWKEFFALHKLANTPVAPRHNNTKLKAPEFQCITGWAGKTNEHGRDAAMLIFGR